MKARHYAFGIATIALATLVLAAGCDLFGRSAQATIDQFEGYVKTGDLASIYLVLDPAAAQYNQAKTADYWNVYFPNTETYTFALSVSGSSASGTISSNAKYASTPLAITLSKSGMDYVISAITLNNTTIFN